MSFDEADDERIRRSIVHQSEPSTRVVWWYRWGALLATAAFAAVIWVLMIGPREATPKTDMVIPATSVLDKGIKHSVPVKDLAKQMNIAVKPPDLRQLGGKLTNSSSADFGGEKAVLMQYQYGKSVFLLYRFQQPSKLFAKMKHVLIKNRLFYFDSGNAVSVVSWQDKKTGFWALAAKATEKDLLSLADKMAASV